MNSGITIGKVMAVILILALVTGVALIGSLVELNGAGEICVVQSLSGNLKVVSEPGPIWQGFGDVTKYKKSYQHWFSEVEGQGTDKKDDVSIKCRFNEGGHANISGSVRIDMPQEREAMLAIHTKFGSQSAVEHELIRTTIERAVYMAGPLMSSQESSAEKRPLLLTYIEDQAANGVYSTTVKDVKVDDPITGEKKTVSIVEIKTDQTGNPIRAEESPLSLFKIRLYGLSINEVKYDDTVEKQIAQQQEAKMAVQIAVANSKKAEQDALTAAKVGEANAAKAKWEQEVVKATEVTKAQKELEVETIAANKAATVAKIAAQRDLAVAELAKQAAEQTKQKEILLGEGESTRMKLVMAANGALEQKLKTYENVAQVYANALAQFKGSLVPTVVMGGTGAGTGGNSALSLIELLTAKAAKDLALDFTFKGTDLPVATAVPAKAN